MKASEKRLYRCCFTGHRPEKIGQPEYAVKRLLEEEIRRAIFDGLYVFISGMARGVDILAAEVVLKLRDEGLGIRLICASPYEGFELGWKEEWQSRYNKILETADLVRFICPKYSRSCFQERNKWLVDHSSRVIAVYNGGSGGTRNTIEYAKRIGVPINILEA